MGCKHRRAGTATGLPHRRQAEPVLQAGKPVPGALWRRGALPERSQAHPGPRRAAWLRCRSAELWTGRSGSSRCGRSPETCKDRAALSRCPFDPLPQPPAQPSTKRPQLRGQALAVQSHPALPSSAAPASQLPQRPFQSPSSALPGTELSF